MKAIQIRSFGNAAELEPREVVEPSPAPGEAQVRVDAAGVDPSDVKNFEGRMRQTRLPRILGRDFAGTVLEGPASWIGRKVWGVGGETFQPSLASLAHRGRMVSIASTGSTSVTFNLIDFYHRELTLIGLDTLALDFADSTASLREILPDLQSADLRPLPSQTFPLEKIPEAFQRKGKAVLLPNG